MKSEVKMLLGLGVVSVIIVGAVLLFSGGSASNNQKTADSSLLVRSESTQDGPADAKVTLVEFGDFQCPACKAIAPTIERIRTDYKGKILLVFRHFPLPSHRNSKRAAQAAEAAGEQGKFWEMYAKIYENQDSWSTVSDPVSTFVDYAKVLGLDAAKFEQEVRDNKFSDKINSDLNDGQSLGVNSTPTLYLNGEKLKGLPTYEQFKSRIDSLLEGS